MSKVEAASRRLSLGGDLQNAIQFSADYRRPIGFIQRNVCGIRSIVRFGNAGQKRRDAASTIMMTELPRAVPRDAFSNFLRQKDHAAVRA
jgi:hypothetical protein